MTDYRISLNQHCSCTQVECPIRGNCVLCIQNHLEHKRHIPECFQNILRPAVKELADQMELQVDDIRPDAAFWSGYDKDDLIKRSLEKHQNKNVKSDEAEK
jgi:hypothetical protein